MYKLNKGISSFSGKRRAILFFAYNFLHLPTVDVKMARVLGLTMEVTCTFASKYMKLAKLMKPNDRLMFIDDSLVA